MLAGVVVSSGAGRKKDLLIGIAVDAAVQGAIDPSDYP